MGRGGSNASNAGSGPRPFIGNAAMGILNVAPDPVDGTVWVRADVDWPSDLRVRLNFIILN
jgi:hypothetical protein